MIRKAMVIGIIILLIGMNATGSYSRDIEEETVSPVGFIGNTLYVGGSGPNNYTTIQSAINDAVDGDTVFVYDDSSPYYEIIDINKMIDVVGEDKNTTIIDGGGAWMVVNITKEKATLQGFYIQEGSYGIYIKVSDSIVCDNNINNVITGISVGSDSSGSHIKNNVLSCDFQGIDISGDRNIITGNLITAHTYGGIYLSFCKYNIISENTVINNGMTDLFSADIHLGMDSRENIISNNTLIAVDKENRFGIKFEMLFIGINNIIENNSINGYNTGIILSYGIMTTIHHNDISDCDKGILLEGSMLNKITENNFIANNKNAEFHLFSFLNRWDGNYWDGPQDSPYPIFGNIGFGLLFPVTWINFDWNPAQEPYDIGGSIE